MSLLPQQTSTDFILIQKGGGYRRWAKVEDIRGIRYHKDGNEDEWYEILVPEGGEDPFRWWRVEIPEHMQRILEGIAE